MKLNSDDPVRPFSDLVIEIANNKEAIVDGCLKGDPVCILIKELTCNINRPFNEGVLSLLQAALNRFYQKNELNRVIPKEKYGKRPYYIPKP